MKKEFIKLITESGFQYQGRNAYGDRIWKRGNIKIRMDGSESYFYLLRGDEETMRSFNLALYFIHKEGMESFLK